MSLHVELLGEHPTSPHMFNTWMECDDVQPTDNGCHRALRNLISTSDDDLVDWLARLLIEHHYDDSRINRLKAKYQEIGFPEYAEQNRNIPRADKTKKGNATEILLIDYVEGVIGKPLIKAFKLRYNPNVDQSIKGDDTLMVDLINDSRDIKIYLGEAKFRKTPTKAVVNSITSALSKEKLPLSYSFLINELARSEATKHLSDLLDNFLLKDIKTKGNIVYTGLLLSDITTFDVVTKHFTSDNPELIFISASIEDPEDLINDAFRRAEELMANPTSL